MSADFIFQAFVLLLFVSGCRYAWLKVSFLNRANRELKKLGN